MNLVIFAMLGGSIGWGLSRTTCTPAGKLARTTNILTGISGAVIAGWFLIPLLGAEARNDFTVTVPVVSLGAVVVLAIVAILRPFPAAVARVRTGETLGHRWKIGLAASLSRVLHASRHGR
jgi:uncharacterized membrane protein YeaQ/YmgE (transglycosylase-associated protein family)